MTSPKFTTTQELFAALRADYLSTTSIKKGQPKKVNLMTDEQLEKWANKPIFTYNQVGLVIKRSTQHESRSAYNAMTKDATKHKTLEQWVDYACEVALSEIKRMGVYPALDHILSEYEATATKQFLGYTCLGNFGGDFYRYATAMVAVLANANTLLQACTTVKNLSQKMSIRNDKVQGILDNTGDANTSMYKQIALDLTYGINPELSTIGDPITVDRYGISLTVQSGGLVRLSWLQVTSTNAVLDQSFVFNGQGFAKKSQVVTWITTQLRKAKFVPTALPQEVSTVVTTDQADSINPELAATVEEGIKDRNSKKNPQNHA